MKRNRKTVFIAGTDTGVGKTFLTGTLVRFLRRQKIHALAIKPFCSGGFDDADFLASAQDNELTRDEIAPFYFPKPLAPYAAVNNKSQLPSLRDVRRKIAAMQRRCEVLLIEGSGGLMVPIGRDFFVVDVIKNLPCDVILVGRNKLGTINHTLLSVNALKQTGKSVKIVLMDQSRPDLSSASNAAVICHILPGFDVFSVHFLGQKAQKISHLEKNCRKLEKTLAQLV